ncbi:MAG: hypothetical protein ACSW8B_00565, partial [bacterium]
EPRFYNTILTYPMGLTYSLCHERIEKEICRYPKRFYGILAALIALFTGYSLLIRKIVFTYEYLYIPVPLLFIVIVIMITMIYDIDNKVLRFFGSHLFEMFILMRIPMILLRHQGITNPYVFTLTSFVISVILAYFYKLLLNKIDACLHL